MTATAFYATANFTPAAAAYSANDVISVAQNLRWTTLKGEVFDGGMLIILSAKLMIATTALQSGEAAYNLALYDVTPPSAHADNDAWDIPAGDRASFQRLLSLGTPVDLGSTLHVASDGLNIPINVLPGQLTFAELVTVGAFTATAVARTVRLHALAP